MRIVVAPNAFKGSLTAVEAAATIARGIRGAIPDVEIVEIPLADGGDGTAEVLLDALGGECVIVSVQDPLGKPIPAAYALVENGQTAVIEMATASGMTLLSPNERNPLITSTYGTGQLIADACRRGVKRIIVGIGGSATNDGGVGALQALGVRFLDTRGEELGHGGEQLLHLAKIDVSGLRFPTQEVHIIVACDVMNLLIGPNGASAVFGPQKGASPEDVGTLDSALANYARKIREQYGIDVKNIPGSGAAGGLGAGLVAFLGAEIAPGIEVVMEAVRFDEFLNGADWVVTGEGKLDAQTGFGKVVSGVARHARVFDVPIAAFAGRVELSQDQVMEMGLTTVVEIAPKDLRTEEAMARAGELLEDAAKQWATEITE